MCVQQLLQDPMARAVEAVVHEGAAAAAAAAVAHAYPQVREATASRHVPPSQLSTRSAGGVRGTTSIPGKVWSRVREL